MSPTIRPAARNDALHVAAIIDLAGHGVDLDSWAAAAAQDGALLDAARRAVSTDPTQPVHYSKAWLAEIDGDIAGGLVGGIIEPGADHSTLIDTPALAPLVELETLMPGWWLVLALAVYREFRGRGIARALLDHADRLGRQAGASGLFLIVEDTNAEALALYGREGFRTAERRPWLRYGHRTGPSEWILMTRPF